MSKRGTLICLAAMLAALLPGLFQIAWPFLTAFLVAAILAIVIHPANTWLSGKIRRPGLATSITTFATVVVLGSVLVVAGLAITQELKTTYDALSLRSLDEGGWPALTTHTTDRVVEALATHLPLNQSVIRAELVDRMEKAIGYLLNNAGVAVDSVTSILITGLLATVFLYFLLRHGRDWVGRMAARVPLDPGVTANLFQAVSHSVVANVNGVLAVVLGQGLLLALGFWIVGVHSPVLWGAIGGLASIIPVVGSPLIWVPVAAAYVFMGAYWKALFLGLWGAFIAGSVDNLLRAFVVRGHDKQHPVVIGLAAIGGTYAFGVLGILLGPIMVSLALALLREIQVVAWPGRQRP